MLMWIAAILVILWALGFFAIHIGGGLIHLLLIIALVVFVYDVLVRRRNA